MNKLRLCKVIVGNWGDIPSTNRRGTSRSGRMNTPQGAEVPHGYISVFILEKFQQ